MNKILVTGSAGFIGSALTINLLNRGNKVLGIDNHNDYYETSLKEDRLKRFANHPNYSHLRIDLCDTKSVENAFTSFKPISVVNLAAQAGVRNSIINPLSYINSNIVGFNNILEASQKCNVEHLVYASSSSVYGANTLMPFSTHHNVDHPLSMYAASKKSNELMAHVYSHLYNLPTTGLRFFTVYGPWGRPDMALFKFTKSILADKPIDVFNYGKHKRDYTFIDDIIEGIVRVLGSPSNSDPKWSSDNPDPGTSNAPWSLYNIGNNKPIELIDYIYALEKSLCKKAKINLLPLQQGDVPNTFADINSLFEKFNYKPSTSLEVGIEKFTKWYMDYYKLTNKISISDTKKKHNV